MYVYMLTYMWVATDAKEGIISPGAIVLGSCELPDSAVGNQTALLQ